MHPSQSMNQFSEPASLDEMQRRAIAYEAQRAAIAAPQNTAAQYQQEQYARIAAPTGYVEPMVPSVYAEAAWEAKQRTQEAGLRNQADFAAYVADRSGKGQRLGEALGGGVLGLVQQANAHAKTFRLETLLAVLRSRKAVLTGRPHFDEACRELDTLIDIFQRMEGP